MKKNISMILALSASLLLTACPGKKGKNWSDKEQATMKEHLYGNVLPYLDVEGKTEVIWDEDYEEITFTCDYVTAEQSAKYAESFVAAGFEGGALDEEYYPGAYSFNKKVETNEGERFINVSFYTFDEEDEDYYVENGSFVLEAYDPYYYTWTEVSELAYYLMSDFVDVPSDDTVIPAFSATYYEFDTMWYEYFGADYFDIYAYGPKVTCVDYAEALVDAGYKVTTGSIQEEGVVYEYYDAISANEDLELQVYDFGEYVDIAVMSYVAPVAWPSEEIASALVEMGISNVVVPELTGFGEVFNGFLDEDDYGLFYEVDGIDETGDMADKYAAIIAATENWVVEYNTDYEEYVAYSSHGEVCIEFYSEDGSFVAWIYEGDGEEHAPDTTNYGSKEAPLSVSDVLAIAEEQCKADTDTTRQMVYVTGTVKDAGTWNTKGYYNNVVITDGTKEVLIYSVNLESSLGSITLGVGDTISVYGYVKNWKGTIEIADKTVGGQKVYPMMYGYTKKAVVTPTSIEIDKTFVELPLGSSIQLFATLGPDGAEGEIEWFSSNEEVATVVNGVVTTSANAHAGDECQITAKCGSLTSAACTITIAQPIPVSGIALDKTEVSIEAGKSATLVATVSPEGASGQVTWTSSNESVATVEGGVVTVKSDATAGSTTTITAACEGFSATCVVTVKEASKVVTDVLTYSDLIPATVEKNAYTDFSAKSKTSSAAYSGQIAMQNGSIQIRSKNNNSGIVSSTSGGKIASVSVVFGSDNTSTKDIEIYASNTPFSVGDMYSGTNCTKVGAVNSSNTSYTFEADYAYVGIKSSSGAFYMASISFTWNA